MLRKPWRKAGYNIRHQTKRQEFLSDVFGNGMANFIENGITVCTVFLLMCLVN